MEVHQLIVKKQDGRLEEFSSNKILESIKKASLAVEVKDDDIQRKTVEIQSIKQQLIESGYDPDEALDQAESQFEGYLDNGVYTEYDEDEAIEVLGIVLEGLDGLGLDEDEQIETSVIQDFVEKALLSSGHIKTAKEYMMKRANRARIREMNSSLMRSFEDLTFGRSEDVETKRENANIDGDSSMGTMLKYGSEGAKKFNLLYVVPPDASDSHSRGDIHIHDLDFYSLTETCTVSHMKVVAKLKGSNSKPTEMTIEELAESLGIVETDVWVNPKSSFIWSFDSFKKIKGIVRHEIGDKKVLRIHSNAVTIEVTDNHLVTIQNESGYSDIKASELKIGDTLFSSPYIDSSIQYAIFDTKDYIIDSIDEIEYTGYVYDVETGDNHFMINGAVVHNCCQIDLEKLFKGGFNTGHGFLREPGEIRSYAALACIAIQSNQNDQHKSVA